MIRDIATIIGDIVGDLSFAEELITSIHRGLREHAIGEYSETLVLRRFERALDSVIIDVNSHPTGELLKTLIREESDLTIDEIIQCLEFIYSHMVNKFQGDLAEFLSLAICSEIGQKWKSEGRLNPKARYIWGDDIRERRSTNPGSGWHKGADGLFVVEEAQSDDTSPRAFETGSSLQTTDLAIFGVVEVKSYAISYRRAATQIEKHLARLQGGLKIAEREWSPDHLYFVWQDAKREILVRTPVIGATHPEIMRLLVKPRPAKKRASPRLPRNAFERTLPYPKKILATAAYNMTGWFIASIGGRVFKEHPSPWPEFTPEEAGVNAVKAALYYIGLRDLPWRQMRIATRLYNVYGFGYENAEQHKDMIWSIRGELVSESKESEPTMDVPPEMELGEVVDCAWSFYRRCHMEEAMAYIDKAMSMIPDDYVANRLKWLRGMIHYFRAEFDKAAQTLPTPVAEHQAELWSWAEDKLTLARIFVRLDRVEDAAREIEEVSMKRLPDKSLLVSIPVCEAMVFIKRGQTDEAYKRLEVAFSRLGTMFTEMADRKARGLGIPLHYCLSGIQRAVMDMATAFALLGHLHVAMEILHKVKCVFQPALLLMKRDPALEPLRQDAEQGLRYQTWLKDREREADFGFSESEMEVLLSTLRAASASPT